MTSKPKNKLKSAATQADVPQSVEACSDAIKTIGDLQREMARMQADVNDAIANITNAAAPQLQELHARIASLQAGVQTWCEAHRDEITQGGKTKTANLVTGEVAWRQRPPSAIVTNAQLAIEQLQAAGLTHMVRTKAEINKDAVLAEPQAVAGIKGLRVVTGVEDFSIMPFAVSVDPMASAA